VSDQFGRHAAIAVLRDALRPSSLAQSAYRFCATIGDTIFALLILIAGLTAWSPRIGFEAARDAVAARRERRSMIREIRRTGGAVWARQARRNASASAYSFRVGDSGTRPDR
jgi:hypothetical protein